MTTAAVMTRTNGKVDGLDADRLHRGVSYVARRLLFSVRELSDSDRNFLGDLARDEVRYAAKMLARLIAISRRSERAEDRYALAECIRGLCVADDRNTLNVALAFDAETIAVAIADPVQRKLERFRDRAAKEEAIECLTRQLAATRAALDAVAAMPIQ